MTKRTYFVSGHLDLTREEFQEHYASRLTQAVHEGAAFVVGDAQGCDAMTQEFLIGCGAIGAGPVTVFHMFKSTRNNVGSHPTSGGYRSDAERDTAMTQASDADIAWIRPGREDSGTAKNIARRNNPWRDARYVKPKHERPVLTYYSDAKEYIVQPYDRLLGWGDELQGYDEDGGPDYWMEIPPIQ